MPDQAITVVNLYRLLSGREAFVVAVNALARRVEAEGHPGVLEYRFFCPEGADDGRAVVRYRDAEAWVGHHDLAMGWPEMAAFRAVAELERIDLYGPVTKAMQDWIDRMGLADRVFHAGGPVAGFSR
ncbi:antibiotic biosynthesis monooxygenase [Tabrizicola sp.]|uniref:antibiotic biosynthesis monooxygenase n=1 Tax=Tabrizicola sp. TaxID=2005166 RepID=UPI003F3F9F3C